MGGTDCIGTALERFDRFSSWGLASRRCDCMLDIKDNDTGHDYSSALYFLLQDYVRSFI